MIFLQPRSHSSRRPLMTGVERPYSPGRRSEASRLVNIKHSLGRKIGRNVCEVSRGSFVNSLGADRATRPLQQVAQASGDLPLGLAGCRGLNTGLIDVSPTVAVSGQRSPELAKRNQPQPLQGADQIEKPLRQRPVGRYLVARIVPTRKPVSAARERIRNS